LSILEEAENEAEIKMMVGALNKAEGSRTVINTVFERHTKEDIILMSNYTDGFKDNLFSEGHLAYAKGKSQGK